jgi:hypothetical protein
MDLEIVLTINVFAILVGLEIIVNILLVLVFYLLATMFVHQMESVLIIINVVAILVIQMMIVVIILAITSLFI